MLARLSVVALLLIACSLTACGSSRGVIDKFEHDPITLQNTAEYKVMPLTVSYDPKTWDIKPEEWESFVIGWKAAYIEEIRTELPWGKKIVELNAGDKPTEGIVITTDVYEMDKGGFAGFGGNGYARATVKFTDVKTGKLLYHAKLEGTGSNSGFESAAAGGRLKFAILNISRKVCSTMTGD